MYRTRTNPRTRNLIWAPLFALASAQSTLAAGNAAPQLARPADAAPPALRFAHSPDGLEFRDTGVVFAKRAAAPDLFRMPGGTLLALFDHAPDTATPNRYAAHVCFSRDDGKTWSRPQPVDITDRAKRRHLAIQGDIFLAPDGIIRLYFVEPVADARASRSGGNRSHFRLRSAVTRDGIHYRLDERFRAPDWGDRVADPTPIVIDNRVHLLIRAAENEDDKSSALRHAVSRDARRFARLAPPDLPRDAVPFATVKLADRLRIYVATPDGIRSATSRDARRWDMEDGVRLADATDAAVVRLVDGSYLMLYRPADPASLPSDSPGLTSSLTQSLYGYDLDAPSADAAVMALDTGQPDTGHMPTDADSGDSSGSANSLEASDASMQGGDDFDSDSDVASSDAGTDPVDAKATDPDDEGHAEILDEMSPFPDPDGFAPLPDFTNPVDYLSWYRDYSANPAGTAAYDAYTQLIPLDQSQDGRGTVWPEDTTNMFSDPDYDGPPRPWNPADHPDWESSYQAMRDLVDRFRDASELDGYATPAATRDSTNILLGILLPSLAPHRALAKQTLADAWRMENGRVPPERMRQAFQTTLRAAAHMEEGATLIEGLVGLAECRLVRDNARAALAQDVFNSPEQIAETLHTLREYDRPGPDPTFALRGEHAAAMDLIQYMFTPPAPDGTPQYHPERGQDLLSEFVDDPVRIDLGRLTPNDAYRSIATLDNHYRELAQMMSIGYPTVRAADIAAMETVNAQSTPLTKVLLPSLSRLYSLHARAEADRRATQLAYATELFRARNGRWPASLAELPATEIAPEARTDPFTGRDFGYRVDDNGPRIYSLSENARDDGGVHAPRWNDRLESEDASDDYVFWPPQEK
ncbi:MAG: exo-alpha-sialidase [Phycisphaerae bacterium]|nr:exo-alpha-sialidase [Phycisphaerae bacterium]